MKKHSAVLSPGVNAQRANLPQTVGIAIAVSLALGMLLTDTTDELVAYLCVTAACGVPIALWIQTGSTGIPVMAPISAISFIYYAIPILRKGASFEGASFEPSEVLSGAVTVSIFLGTATLSWWLLIAWGIRRSRSAGPEIVSRSQIERIMFCGLALGVFYHSALYIGWLGWLGPAFGLVRAAMLTVAMAACFILGHARAQGWLQGQKLVLAVTGLCSTVLLAWASLFLVIGMIFLLAAVFGYVITSRRLPWAFLSALVAVIIVLHAGKDKIRAKYWYTGNNYGSGISLVQMPSLMTEWVEDGVMMTSSNDSYSSAIDRASLLILLIRVQRLAPDYVPFLEGKSYEVLPAMLLPRFLFPNKIASQAAMDMLNIRFGFQTVESVQKTAVGWGLIAEAYANFGRLGVVGVALVFGLLCGSLERWSASTALVSLPSLFAVVAMTVLINLELEAAGAVTTLLQSFVAIAIMFWTLKALARKGKPISQRAMLRA